MQLNRSGLTRPNFLTLPWFQPRDSCELCLHQSYCSLLSFDSRKERDAWVAADHFDNNWHRSAVSRREALPLMRAELADLFDGYDGWRVDGVFYSSIGDAFAAFFKAEAAAHRRAGV